MSSSYENRRRRRAVWGFLAAYFGFMLTIIILMLVHSHQLGGGYAW